MAADAFGAEHSFFLINGSTSGNQYDDGAINPGERSRSGQPHKSAMGGLTMMQRPDLMKPEVDEALHTDHTVTPGPCGHVEAQPDIRPSTL